jgi:CRISPR-associated endonuclease/helicase Cas3
MNYHDIMAHYRESDGVMQSVAEHLEGTADLARNFAGKIGFDAFGEIAGLLHDLGKATASFDSYIRTGVGLYKADDPRYYKSDQKMDHAGAGTKFVYQYSRLDETVKTILCTIIKSHHGGLIDLLKPDGEDQFAKKMDKEDVAVRLEEALEKTGSTYLSHIEMLLNSGELETTLKQFLIDLNQRYEKDVRLFMLGLLIRYLFSCLVDADRQDTADFENPQQKSNRQHSHYMDWHLLCERYENHIANFSVRNQIDMYRAEISKQCFDFASKPAGIYQLTVPTGGGKTLSSLRYALHHAKIHKKERIIYVTPFTSIIDQNADVARKILETDEPIGSVVLEQHSNLTEDKETELTRLLSENWDAPVVFTTMVQFLETLFTGGTQRVRRMHQLANAVLIFDEIQTLNVRFVYMFNSALRFLCDTCNSTIVLCTATQPLLNQIEPPKYALPMTDQARMIKASEKYMQAFKRVDVVDLTRPEQWAEADVVDLSMTEQVSSILIIVNTKASARALVEAFESVDVKAYHLSTSMCPSHRMAVLQTLRASLETARFRESKNSKPIICVSTQLIEAGVDVDFDRVIRYMAGMDSIVQAAGRCNRNGLMPDNGRVYIVNAKNEKLDKLKDIQMGQKETKRLLENFKRTPEHFGNDLLDERIMNQYYQHYYFKRQNEMGYPKKIETAGGERNIYDLLAKNDKSLMAYSQVGNHELPHISRRYSFKTAGDAFEVIGNYTQGVIVPYKEGEAYITALVSTENKAAFFETLKKAQRYTINLFGYQIQQLLEAGIIYECHKETGIYALQGAFYNETLGFVTDKQEMSELII